MRRAVLTDIEGTTSSIAFVHDVLFPYARARLGPYLREHADTPEAIAVLAGTRAVLDDPDAPLEACIAALETWSDADRKVTPLKQLQGLVWADGYASGVYRAHVYDDAVRGLRRWHEAGHPLWVYSSGSVRAQELFFGHTTAGDLRPLFGGHFDTTTGSKKAPGSYTAIAEAVGRSPDDVVFLSDVEAELDAAVEAGMRTVWVVRDGPLPSSGRHLVVTSFDGLDPTQV